MLFVDWLSFDYHTKQLDIRFPHSTDWQSQLFHVSAQHQSPQDCVLCSCSALVHTVPLRLHFQTSRELFFKICGQYHHY